MINFRSNCLESAFARISLTLPKTQIFTTKDSNTQEKNQHKEPLAFCLNLKRKISTEDILAPHKKFIEGVDTSPILNNREKMKIMKITYNKLPRFPEKRNKTTTSRVMRESPPFYGFDNSLKKVTKDTAANNFQNNDYNETDKVANDIEKVKKYNKIHQKKNDIPIRKNGTLWVDESYEQKLMQEQADLELAKKLQKEFDQYAHYTRSTRKVGRGSIHRQTTLDQILTGSYRVK